MTYEIVIDAKVTRRRFLSELLLIAYLKRFGKPSYEGNGVWRAGNAIVYQKEG